MSELSAGDLIFHDMHPVVMSCVFAEESSLVVIRWWRSLPPSAVTMDTALLAYVAFSPLDVTANTWTS